MKQPLFAFLHQFRVFYDVRTARGRLALVLVAFGIVSGAIHPSGAALARLASALYHSEATPAERRRQIFGPPYAGAVEAIRRALPATSAYGLVEADEAGGGGALWLRYDLAPRRAFDLGPIADRAAWRSSFASLPHGIQWIVISHGRDLPPELVRRSELRHRLADGGTLAP